MSLLCLHSFTFSFIHSLTVYMGIGKINPWERSLLLYQPLLPQNVLRSCLSPATLWSSQVPSRDWFFFLFNEKESNCSQCKWRQKVPLEYTSRDPSQLYTVYSCGPPEGHRQRDPLEMQFRSSLSSGSEPSRISIFPREEPQFVRQQTRHYGQLTPLSTGSP